MDLLSFIIGFFIGSIVTAAAIVVYIRMMLKRMMSDFSNINMLLEMLKRGRNFRE